MGFVVYLPVHGQWSLEARSNRNLVGKKRLMQYKLEEKHALRIQRTLAQQDALKGQFEALHQRCIVEQLAAVGEASGRFVDLKNVKFDLENLTITIEGEVDIVQSEQNTRLPMEPVSAP